jgi:O-antigen biosynthesis protein
MFSGWNYGRGDQPDSPEYSFASEADYVSGACLAIRARDLRPGRRIRPAYAPAYYEDTDLCFPSASSA